MVAADDLLCYKLGHKESFEYMWNLTVNVKKGISNNIPNDNCVELRVNNIKKSCILKK